MSHKIEQRKNNFKAKNIANSADRLRKQSDLLRKDKRSANVLAKRLKIDTAEPVANRAQFSEIFVNDAIAKIKVSSLLISFIVIF